MRARGRKNKKTGVFSFLGVFCLLAGLALAGCSNVNEDERIYPRDLRESPTLLDSCPKHDQERVSVDAVVRLLFSKDLNPRTVHSGSVILGSGRMFVRGNLFYEDRVVTFVPTEALLPDTFYTLYLTSTLRDIDNLAMSERVESLSFTTGSPGVYTCR